MKTLKSFIGEAASSSDPFMRAKDVSLWISSPRRRQAFIDAMDQMSRGLSDKSMYNARFKDAYSYGMMRGLEEAWENIHKKYLEEVKNDPNHIDMWSLSSLTDIKKLNRLFVKYDIKEIKEFLQSVEGIPDAIKQLKTYLKSGREPSANQIAKVQSSPPMPSRDAVTMATGFLKEAVDSFSKEFLDNLTTTWMKEHDSLKNIKKKEDLPKTFMAKQIAPLIFNISYRGDLELKDDSDSIVRNAAQRTVETIVHDFVTKNTSKLARIFEKKNKPSEHKIIKSTVVNNVIENIMWFKFSDSSSFRIYTQVIYKQSNLGKLFLQFPTRFTDVVMADGTKMGMPSEEKMIKEF